jgi:hypothetical protein
MLIKNILFNLHLYSTYFFTFGWFIHPYILFIQYCILLSWIFIQNKCILTQLEYFFFQETFMGNEPKFIVPKKNRYALYINCMLATLYYSIYQRFIY